MGKLSGMKEICRYVNRSECTTLDWIRNMDMPAKKFGGVWESETELIDDWRKRLIAGVTQTRKPPDGMMQKKKRG